ncbi:MAG TPA: DUF885 domain-containing protein [Pirellulales bacterium]|nr:DUF885 domain-containing protein [Pirellulales bacterium]
MNRCCMAFGLLVSVLAPAAPLRGGTAAEEQLRQLFDEAWQFDLREDPLFATQTGDRRYDDRLPRVRVADFQRRLKKEREFVERLARIDRQKLGARDRTSYEVFDRLRRDQIAEYEFQAYLMPITNRSGFHVEFPELAKNLQFRKPEDYENFISRLKAFAQYAADHIELMRAGIKAGLVLPAVALEGYQRPIEAQIVDDPVQSLLYQPFKKFPESMAEAERARLALAAREAIAASVVPGYRRFLEFMHGEYVPHARGQIAASALPNGREFYRHRVRQFTTLDLTPEQVHATGLAEVARIRKEMDAVIRGAGFEGDFPAFVEFLRSDPRFYVDTPEQLLKEVALVLKKMDGQLPKLFGTLPRAPYGIREIPAYIAPSTTTAYYQPPAGDGSLAGFYYVNTYNLKSRPLYEIEALSLHEAVPGHHLQIALQQELEDLPNFQRFAGFTAFVEGWGLYAERLGLEVGFYEDPYSNFGRLSYEMWRACRLVVDTGMHSLGWTRERAIEFMGANTALTKLNIVNEVDRYIAWPGQALAYKTGELKFRELRGKAEQKLGDRFDVRQFHDIVLAGGAVPLSVLERIVDEYLEDAETSK